MARKKNPYPFADDTQKALATMLCNQPRFYARLGHDVSPEALSYEPARNAARAARVVEADTSAPNTHVLVIQRLRSWMEEGQLTQEDINRVIDMFDEAEEMGLPSEEALVKELAPTLRHRARDKAVQKAIDLLPRQEGMSTIAEAISKAEHIGDLRGHTAIGWGQARGELVSAGSFVRMPTGIPELDRKLEGGFERGALWTWLGIPGGGKSVALVHNAATALLSSLNVCYVSLELSKAKTMARLVANLSGMPVNSVTNGSMDAAFAQLRELTLGKIHLDYFTPMVTTIDHIKDFVKDAEDRHGEKFEVVIIDYGDKIVDKVESDANTYQQGNNVWERYRVWVEDEDRWGITASQAKRRDKKQKQINLGLDDFADSMGKPRVTDGAIAINRTEFDKDVRFRIIKNRNGEAGGEVGPLPTAFALGRIVATNRDYEAPPGSQMEADIWG